MTVTAPEATLIEGVDLDAEVACQRTDCDNPAGFRAKCCCGCSLLLCFHCLTCWGETWRQIEQSLIEHTVVLVCRTCRTTTVVQLPGIWHQLVVSVVPL